MRMLRCDMDTNWRLLGIVCKMTSMVKGTMKKQLKELINCIDFITSVRKQAAYEMHEHS